MHDVGHNEHMIEAVIFDMDGVLIDTHRCAYSVLSDCARAHGVIVSVDDIMQWGSLSGRQFWLRIKKDWSLEQDIDSLMSSYDYEKEISYYSEIGLMPGVESLFARIAEEGLKIGIATSAEKIRINRVLQLGDLSRYITSIVGADDVANHKPHPECYIKSIHHLNSSPARCLVIEDSSNGATAARTAGCRVAAYHGSMWKYDPFVADFYIRDFRQVSSIAKLTAQQGPPLDAFDTNEL